MNTAVPATSPLQAGETLPPIVLVGNPNVGKSALFGALTGKYVTVSNYPGTTVEVSRGSVRAAGGRLEVVDTPGAASFLPFSEDERVTRDILLETPGASVIAVIDAKNLERGLGLALQLSEMEIPFVLALNMSDEARELNIRIDTETLSRILGVDSIPTVAIRGEGVRELLSAVSRARRGSVHVEYSDCIERALEAVAPAMPETPISPRALALMAVCGDGTLAEWLAPRLTANARAQVQEVRERLKREIPESVPYAVGQARSRAAAAIAGRVRRLPSRSNAAGSAPRGRAAAWLDRATTHRIWGWPILAAVLAAAYLFVGQFGAGTLVKLLEDRVFGQWISPLAIRLAQRFIPWELVRDLLVGPYGIITMALAYALALVLPIVGTFFIAFGMLEDS
ncbi:MAG TPA: FeoB small GTPase domain-containing protein, partial [Thermoanaerobaculia bacterium]